MTADRRDTTGPAAGGPVSFGTVRGAWALGREHLAAEGVESAALEAEVLLRHALGIDRTRLFTRWEERVPAEAWARYRRLLERRAHGEPSAYLTGEREFMSLRFAVDRRVLIPRPETETLVEFLLARLRDHPAPLVADIGTGSGAIAVSLAVYLPRARVVATDIARDALAVARENAARHRVADRVLVVAGDLLAPLRGGSLDALASNPPYVPAAERPTLPREIAEHEPAVAVFGGESGIEPHRAIVAGAAPLVRPGGWLALEVAARWSQAAAVARLLEETGAWGQIHVVRDLAGLERVVAAQRTAEQAW